MYYELVYKFTHFSINCNSLMFIVNLVGLGELMQGFCKICDLARNILAGGHRLNGADKVLDMMFTRVNGKFKNSPLRNSAYLC